MHKNLVLVVVAALGCASTLFAASVEKAGMLRRHGLLPQAKAELIDVIFSTAGDATKARAYYDLGSVAFEERNVSAALDTWSQLAEKYPKSDEAVRVKDRIRELADIVGEVGRTSTDNAIAESYVRHADFWSEGKDEIFKIDSSWISNVEAAVKWYDKVIQEFPKTTAARLAYEGKLRALLGWKEAGQYGESHGTKKNHGTYMPQVVTTFSAFETDHPDAGTLQAFRFQIAQQYWRMKDWANTRTWLNTIIEKSGDSDTFYKDLAQRRLQKVEY
jgi:hypothetical protein